MLKINMMPKLFVLCLNICAVKLALSQTIYTAAPTCTYPQAAVAVVPNYQVASVSPAATVLTATPLPASPIASPVPSAAIATVSSSSPIAVAAAPLPVAASPMPVAASSMPVGASPVPVTVSAISMGSAATTEPKAHFVPGPVPDPKVTVLGNIPAVVEVTPKMYPDSPAAYPDPGYIEVKATLCKDGIPSSNILSSKSVLPEKDSSPIAPVKRLTMACANDDPFSGSLQTSILSNQPVCPGISKMDLLPASAATKDKSKNPIDFGGLLDGFMTCL